MTPIAAPYDSGEGLHADERKGHRPPEALTGFALYRLDTRGRIIDMATRLHSRANHLDIPNNSKPHSSNHDLLTEFG